jgi:hypothetical protein
VSNGVDIAWLLVGLFGCLSIVAILYTLSDQWIRSKKLGVKAQTYETVFSSAEALLEIASSANPDERQAEAEEHARTLTELLLSQRTAGDAIEALADSARSKPNVARVLRGRDAAVRAITSWVDEQLASEDAYQRAHAVEVIASLRLRSCRGALAAATSDIDPVVRAASCRALAAIDPSSAIGALLRIVETDGKWAADLLADLLARNAELPSDSSHDTADGGRSNPLAGERNAINARLEDWSATPALLRLADDSMPLSAKRALASALDSGDPELRARAITLLRTQTVEDASEGLERLVNDEVESVRVAAIHALAHFRRPEHVMVLAALVGDASRMVRFTAAEALRLMPNGEQLLRSLALSSDTGASEAASLALWQKEIGADVTLSTPTDFRELPDESNEVSERIVVSPSAHAQPVPVDNETTGAQPAALAPPETVAQPPTVRGPLPATQPLTFVLPAAHAKLPELAHRDEDFSTTKASPASAPQSAESPTEKSPADKSSSGRTKVQRGSFVRNPELEEIFRELQAEFELADQERPESEFS